MAAPTFIRSIVVIGCVLYACLLGFGIDSFLVSLSQSLLGCNVVDACFLVVIGTFVFPYLAYYLNRLIGKPLIWCCDCTKWGARVSYGFVIAIVAHIIFSAWKEPYIHPYMYEWQHFLALIWFSIACLYAVGDLFFYFSGEGVWNRPSSVNNGSLKDLKERLLGLAVVVCVIAFFLFGGRSGGGGGRYYEDMHDPTELDEAIEEEFGVENKGDNSYSSDNSDNSNSDDVVYVCTGPSAECYHVDQDCRGLGNCSGEIEEMSVSSAGDYYRPCSICSN